MKKTLIAMTALLGFGAAQALVLAPVVNATEPATTTTKENQDWLDKLNTKIDLAQAKVSALRAKIALEIEKSPARAEQAMDDAEAWLTKARTTATTEAAKRVDDLKKDARAARDAITNAPAEAEKKIIDLLDRTDKSLQEYKQIVLETDEARLLKKRYAQLEAQAALMKAQLAEKADHTGKQALSHLDKAKAWYGQAKANTAKKWHDTLTAISTRIDAAKQAIKNKRDQAREAIVDLARRAGELVRPKEAGEPAK